LKYLKQLSIILGIYFLGLFIEKTFHLPVPGNVIGMILLFLGLCSGVIKLHMIEEVSEFFLNHLAFFFIPAGVGLITCMDVLKGSVLKLLLIIFLTTIIVLGSTGLTVQVMKQKEVK